MRQLWSGYSSQVRQLWSRYSSDCADGELCRHRARASRRRRARSERRRVSAMGRVSAWSARAPCLLSPCLPRLAALFVCLYGRYIVCRSYCLLCLSVCTVVISSADPIVCSVCLSVGPLYRLPILLSALFVCLYGRYIVCRSYCLLCLSACPSVFCLLAFLFCVFCFVCFFVCFFFFLVLFLC